MLSEKIQNLYSLSWKLIHLGLDGTPIYSCEFSRLNGEVFRLCNELYAEGCEDAAVEERAFFYLSLLKGYVATSVMMEINKTVYSLFLIIAGRYLSNFQLLY